MCPYIQVNQGTTQRSTKGQRKKRESASEVGETDAGAETQRGQLVSEGKDTKRGFGPPSSQLEKTRQSEDTKKRVG